MHHIFQKSTLPGEPIRAGCQKFDAIFGRVSDFPFFSLQGSQASDANFPSSFQILSSNQINKRMCLKVLFAKKQPSCQHNSRHILASKMMMMLISCGYRYRHRHRWQCEEWSAPRGLSGWHVWALWRANGLRWLPRAKRPWLWRILLANFVRLAWLASGKCRHASPGGAGERFSLVISLGGYQDEGVVCGLWYIFMEKPKRF